MNRIVLTWSLLLVMQLNGASRESAWKSVEEAAGQGLPRTAVERLEPIINGAIADRAWGEAVKAMAFRLTYEGQIEGNQPEAKITRLEAELARAPAEIVPMLQTVLAHWYWHYYQQNQWRFMRRTATAEAPGEDFTTWDLKRLFAEIDRQFERALVAADALKQIPIGEYADLLIQGGLPDRYRPTLFDFIAQEALSFYTAGEQAGARPEGAFEIAATDPALGPVARFLAWTPQTSETDAPALKAIRLYQALLRFHAADTDPTAFLDLDLARLNWARNVAFGEEKDERFEAALTRFIDANADHEIASMALWHLARSKQEQDDPTAAHALASRGRTIHPNSPGGQLCENLVRQIEAPSASLRTERVWTAPWPDLEVTYRNVTTVWFRAIAWDWQEVASGAMGFPDRLDDAQRDRLLARAPALEWQESLPATTDYREHTASLAAPATLRPGSYVIVASHRADFRPDGNQLSLAEVWVSKLALVLRTGEEDLGGFVLEAESGEPLAGVRVEAWRQDSSGRRRALTRVETVRTDAQGLFVFKQSGGPPLWVRAVHEEGSLARMTGYRPRGRERVVPEERTVFFTDRAIYRPGQTVQYKGICLRADRAGDDYSVLGGRALTVTFFDPNGKEIVKRTHRCNDYGSFSGSFTAPADRVAGRMRLQATDGPDGVGWLQVEEYKRPKFQVTLEAPATAPKLAEEVRMIGKAMAYTGAAIDGAKVKWRVTRETQMPWWWGGFGRRLGWPVGEAAEIAHGTAETAVDGTFTIGFVANPDRRVPAADQPTFRYRISADVTDLAGETRSDERSVRVGYVALNARINVPEWLPAGEPIPIEVRTTTLDGEPQLAEGSLKIHALQAPDRVQRASLVRGINGEPDGSDPRHWPLGPVAQETGFTTDAEGRAKVTVALTSGVYRAVLSTQDRFGKSVTAALDLRVIDPSAGTLALKVPSLLAAPAWSVEPGSEFTAIWGTGYPTGRAFIEILHRDRRLQAFWTEPGRTQATIRQPVWESFRGGFTLRVTQVRENRAYLESRTVNVPWSNKQLALRWEHFTSKLAPGQKETWSLVVSGADAGNRAAEMVATLYDASLDAFLPHRWSDGFDVFRTEPFRSPGSFANAAEGFRAFAANWWPDQIAVDLSYRAFPPELSAPPMLYPRSMMARGARVESLAMPAMAMDAAPMAAEGAAMEKAQALPEASVFFSDGLAPDGDGMGGGAEVGDRESPAPDLSRVSARRNLNETAFFFPHLVAEPNGEVRLSFTMPEALTEWRFLGFAHDSALRAGLLEGTTVTAKDLMVQPNPPRFLREGDVIEFTVKVTNQGDATQQGRIRLEWKNAISDVAVDELLGNRAPEQAFAVPARESRTYAWRLSVPDGLPPVTYRVVAASSTLSDGEEGMLPVVARRVLVTESLPLPIRGPATREFRFADLLDAGRSDTLSHQSLTVQMVSNPAWYAVMALPFLMEFPHECNEQTFNRLYANALARFIANSDPRIRRVFDQWRNTPALDSPLEKNQDLKALLLEATPWWRQAQNESEARRNVGVLFDDNRLNNELDRALRKLIDSQQPDGRWSWFPGGSANDYITLYITTGFGRLRHLGVDLEVSPALRALDRLDEWLRETHDRIRRDQKLDGNHLTSRIALQLYGRSFFLKDQPVADASRAAYDYFLAQARQYWVQLGERQSQGHLALALLRFGDAATPAAIVKSLKERSVTDDELGRFWRDTELSWWWFRAPIETQALMIEVFAEVARDEAAVDECQTWLLKQKQTQDWKTTKATADAIYALLLRGRNLLASDKLVEVRLAGTPVKPVQVEAGTGFYEQRFAGSEVRPAMGNVTVVKPDDGVAWGGVHWQYFEEVGKVEAYQGTPLKLDLRLFTKTDTARGPELRAVSGSLAVGDELVSRLELRVDRDMEYVHLQLPRGSGTEPVNVLSGYRFQDGLAYYETTRDTATHCFIDYLPKGTYVFETSVRVQLRGEYQTGFASIQCMYAPEFNSHSASVKLEVQ